MAGSTSEAGATGAAQGELDPLVGNGLGSPTCAGSDRGELAAANRKYCETSGFIGSAAPTGNYGIDVHIDTGVLGLSRGSLLQDLLVSLPWMALVWAVHALVVMLEWCFTIDLLGNAVTGGFGSGLRQMERAFTEPWLPLALTVAAVLALYHGLIRRRVVEAAGQVALMAAMMAGGLWVILDPTGTIGALGQWADQAAIGTLAVAAQGSPSQPERALGENLEGIFTAAVQAPWCYLEFGDVDWCRSQGQLDRRLYRAGLKIAAEEQSLVGCKVSPLVPCAAAGSARAKVLEHSAELLRDARSNGAIFLALPANGPARNSINDDGSLLRALCNGSTATGCSGPSAAQAEFRTDSSTLSRVGGLMLIAAGLLGMLLLLGFLALRLLAAAIFSLLYLLLAPAMVLAPAFGDGGRALFRRWISQLLGTITAKLIYSFLLGIVMAVLAVIASLSAIGWWTQWLLMSALWWGAFIHRHHALGVAKGVSGGDGRSQSVTRRLGDMLEKPRKLAGRHREKRKQDKPAPPVGRRPDVDAGGSAIANPADDGAKTRLQTDNSPEERSKLDPSSSFGKLIAERGAQLERIGGAREEAGASGQQRRASELSARGTRVAQEIEELRDASNFGAQSAEGASMQIPARDSRTAATDRISALEQDRRIPHERDASSRESALALREELTQARVDTSSASLRHPSGRGQPPSHVPRDRSGRVVGSTEARASESIVMRDAREVEAGRKRQLGRDRP